TVIDVAYLEPAIVIHKSNIDKIHTLKDLLKAGKIGIADPETVCLGNFALEIFEKNFSEEEQKLLKSKIAVYAESCEKVATIVALNSVDAAIGWSVFQYWNDNIKAIPLSEKECSRKGIIQAAMVKYSSNKIEAQKFLDFLKSDKVRKILKKHHYNVS
ncbi:MAG: substrate-binding domain-containing protein, partial [bacterium]